MSSPFEILLENQRTLWVIAVLLYGVGDGITTLYGLQFDTVEEVGPVAAVAMRRGGTVGFLLLKGGFIAACFLVWLVVPFESRLGIPLALIFVGAAVTLWNLHILRTKP